MAAGKKVKKVVTKNYNDVTKEYNDSDDLSVVRSREASKNAVTEREDTDQYDNHEPLINNDYNDYDDRRRAHKHFDENKNQSDYKNSTFYENRGPKVDANDRDQQKIDAPENIVNRFGNPSIAKPR